MPHLMKAIKELPDAVSPVVWVYPFDEYSAAESEYMLKAMNYEDWFITETITEGCLISSVTITSLFAKQLKIGDGIRFAVNTRDEIVGLTIMFSVEGSKIYSGSSSFNAETRIVSGVIYRIQNQMLQFMDAGEVFNYGSATVYVYDHEKKTLKLGSQEDILDYSSGGEDAQLAYLYARRSLVRTIVLIK